MDKQLDSDNPPSPLKLEGDDLKAFIENMTDEQRDKVAREIKKSVTKQFLDPSDSASYAISGINKGLAIDDSMFGIEGIKGLDVTALRHELEEQHEALASGDISRIENMLFDQAHTLQAIFMHFLQRLPNTEYLSQSESYSRLALKAQNQCRQTLATLGDLKNPKRATFIKQQNNTLNQIDNVTQDNPENSINDTTKLSEASDERTLDSRATKAAVGENPQMETVGEVHRCKDF